MATEVQEIARRRDRLAEELAALDREQATLEAKLLPLLGRPLPESAPPNLPAGTSMPLATWR